MDSLSILLGDAIIIMVLAGVVIGFILIIGSAIGFYHEAWKEQKKK